jgi:hypothetical protein
VCKSALIGGEGGRSFVKEIRQKINWLVSKKPSHLDLKIVVAVRSAQFELGRWRASRNRLEKK